MEDVDTRDSFESELAANPIVRFKMCAQQARFRFLFIKRMHHTA